MKEQFIQTEFVIANRPISEPIRLTTQPQTPHTGEREVILMDSRGAENGLGKGKAPSGELFLRPRGAEQRGLGAPKDLKPDQLLQALSVPDQVVKEEIGVEPDRFSSGRDSGVVSRLKYWIYDLRHRREQEKLMKGKRTEDEFVDELVKFNNDVVGGGTGIRDVDILRDAGRQVILKQAKAAGYSPRSILDKYFLRDDAIVQPKREIIDEHPKRDYTVLHQENSLSVNTDTIPDGAVKSLLNRHNHSPQKLSPEALLETRNKLIQAAKEGKDDTGREYTLEERQVIEKALDQFDSVVAQQVLLQTSSSEGNENRSRLKQDEPPIQMEVNLDSVPEGVVRDLLARHNQAPRGEGFPVNSDQLMDLRRQLNEAYATGKHSSGRDYTDDEKGQIVNALSQFDNIIAQVALREQEANSRRYGAGRQYMDTAVIMRPKINPDGTLSNEEVRVKERDIYLDRSIRDEVFNSIFANVDAQTNTFFREAWSPLTDGRNYEEFMGDLRKASQTPGQIIPREVIQEWLTLNQNNQDPRYEVLRTGTDQDKIRFAYKTIQDELLEDLERYKTEFNVRKNLHDANAIINIPRLEAEQIFGYIEQFGADLQDYTSRMAGVRQMMDIFEMQTRQVMAENGGYLPPEAIRGKTETKTVQAMGGMGDEGARPINAVEIPEIERRSKDYFKHLMNSGSLFLRDETTGMAVDVSELKDWQIDRIYATARGMSLLSMRLLSLAAESALPPNGEYTSLFMQDALQIYAPYVHLMAKYYVPADKVLTALLYNPGEVESIGEHFANLMPDSLSFLKHAVNLIPGRGPFSNKQYKDMYHMMHEGDARSMLDGRYGAKLELRKQNPMYCGDAYTYLTWRAGTEVKDITASREFLRKGAKRMVERRLGRAVSLDELLQRRPHTSYVNLADPHENPDPTEDDIIATNAYILEHGGEGVTRDNIEAIKEHKRLVDEYGNWIGTGFRFERLRQDLEKGGHPDQEGGYKGLTDEAERFGPAKAKAEKLLQRIVEIQPHRIYLKSRIIQERLKHRMHFSPTEMQHIQENLSFLETKMYQMREQLLDQGYTFDGEIGQKFMLTDIHRMLQDAGQDLPHPDAWGQAQEFMRIMQEDFRENKDTIATYKSGHGHDEEGHPVIDPHFDVHTGHAHKEYNISQTGYMQEFVYERDYHHGYVLWSGDAPVEEFHFTSVGGTGGYIRRAGENKDVMGGVKGTLELLSHLHDQYITPDAAYAKIYEIYAAVKNYDVYMAKKLATDLAEGVAKFYGEQSLTRIPYLGLLLQRKGMGSFAQVVYGKRAPVWNASEIHYFMNDLLKDHGVILSEQEKYLERTVNATTKDHFVNLGTTVGQIALLAAILFILKEGVEDGLES